MSFTQKFPSWTDWPKQKTLVVCILGLLFIALGSIPSSVHRDGNASILKREASPNYWQPTAGAKCQIQLKNTFNPKSVAADVTIVDLDLFDNTAETIAEIHKSDQKVICYFSAGTYENWRDDEGDFKVKDKGNTLDEWPGEKWLDLRSGDVRTIMTKRLDQAHKKGCDAVDPDNIDAYGNDNGLELTEADSIDFLDFLASETHKRGMSIGLKNGGDILGSVMPWMDFGVVEQCAEYNECSTYEPLTEANKLVIQIEYADGDNASNSDDDSDAEDDSNSKFDRRSTNQVSSAQKQKSCNSSGSKEFSTVIKNLDLDAWVQYC